MHRLALHDTQLNRLALSFLKLIANTELSSLVAKTLIISKSGVSSLAHSRLYDLYLGINRGALNNLSESTLSYDLLNALQLYERILLIQFGGDK